MTEEEKHQIIRAKGLEDKNIFQAKQLMKQELQIKAALRLIEIYHEQDKKMTIEGDNKDEKKGEILPFNQPKLSILTGGKDGSSNWLSDMEEGSVFISRMRKEGTPICEQWHLSIKWEKSAVLLSNFPHRGDVTVLVNMQMFAEQNELIEILREGKEEIEYGD